MIRLQGRMPTAEASRYLTRLCFHFSRKIRVDYDEEQGRAEFPWGVCRFVAGPQALHFDCEAEDAERLERVRFAIDEHVKLFSRKAPLSVAWEAASASG